MADLSPNLPGIRQAVLGTLRQNRVACLGLNLLVITLVASYYLWPEVAAVWAMAGELKLRWSYGFSLVSTIFAAVVVPAIAQRAMGIPAAPGEGKRIAWSALFWGYRGMEIDLFYRFQGRWFGHGHDAFTLAKKLAVDQFVYSVLWAVPSYLVFVWWVDSGGDWSRIRKLLNRRFWSHTYLAVLFTNWLVWIPAVTLVYSLPAPLQFPLFSVVLSFYILLITVLVREQRN